MKVLVVLFVAVWCSLSLIILGRLDAVSRVTGREQSFRLTATVIAVLLLVFGLFFLVVLDY